MSTYKKIFSLALLLSVLAFANTRMYAKGFDSSCDKSSRDCGTECSTDRDCDDDCSTDDRRDCSTDCFRSGRSGKTFFSPRSITFDSTYELSLTNYHVYHSNSYCGPRSTVGFYVTPFYQESTRRNRHDHFFKTGFSHDGDTLLTGDARTGNNGDNGNRRPRRHHERRVYGAVFTIYTDLCGLFCDGAWGSINFAAVEVEHRRFARKDRSRKSDTIETCNDNTLPNGTVRQCETIVVTTCEEEKDFKNRCSKDRGVDDIQIKLGYDYFLCNNDHVGLYIVGGIPTHRRCKDTHIFDPRAGSRHGSIGFGLNTDYTVWQGCASNINWMADFKYRYVLKRDEIRPFDCDRQGKITHKECVRVKPKSTIDFWTALHYEQCCWNFEVGYDLFWRDREEICRRGGKKQHDTKLNANTACEPKTVTELTVTPVNGAITADAQHVVTGNINKGNTDFKHDLNNARHERITNHKVYGAVGYSTSICNYPTLLGIGGSYEFARCRDSFDHWAVFGKLGVQF